MGRIFICGFYNFPRGGAAANYVQYLAKVFMSLGKDVVAITNTNKEIHLCNNEYQGIRIESIELKKDKIGHYLDFNFRMGRYYKKILKKYKLIDQDLIIAYSRDSSTLREILKIGKKTGVKTGICLVEWFEKKDFDKGAGNLSYWNSQYAFYCLNKKFDFIFPISTFIEEYYKKRKCNTFRIPCLADTYEFDFKEKCIEKKKIFIFPGNGKMKDALFEMLQSISMLRNEEIEKLEFHICGISKYAKQVVKEMKLEQYLGSAIVIHDWMRYDELVSLYQKTHFLLLARNISRMTLANFPSKIPETLSYGIIPICSRVGDYTDLYLKDGENSLIIEGCDVTSVVGGIRRALRMTSKEVIQLSNQCRKTAVEQFDYRQWIEPVQNFLNRNVYTEKVKMVEDKT